MVPTRVNLEDFGLCSKIFRSKMFKHLVPWEPREKENKAIRRKNVCFSRVHETHYLFQTHRCTDCLSNPRLLCTHCTIPLPSIKWDDAIRGCVVFILKTKNSTRNLWGLRIGNSVCILSDHFRPEIQHLNGSQQSWWPRDLARISYKGQGCDSTCVT